MLTFFQEGFPYGFTFFLLLMAKIVQQSTFPVEKRHPNEEKHRSEVRSEQMSNSKVTRTV